MNKFKQNWIEKNEHSEDTFEYHVHVRLTNGDEFDLDDTVKALTSYDASKKIERLLSDRYPRARFSKYSITKR
jgi:hypothetical protein